MYKLISIITKPETMSLDEFSHYWRNIHSELAKKLPGLRRYVQNHISEKLRASEQKFQASGFVELWFDSQEAMQQAFSSEIGQQLIADEKNFINQIDAFSVDEVLIKG